MSKAKINKILIGIIIFLLISIVVLIILISVRPRYINVEETDSIVFEEVPAVISSQVTKPDDVQSNNSTEEATKISRGKTSTKVNIRELANSDSRVLETVEAGYEFEIIEVLDNGWTRIKYKDSEAYISSLYVILLKE